MSGDVVICVLSEYCLCSIHGRLKEDPGPGKCIFLVALMIVS